MAVGFTRVAVMVYCVELVLYCPELQCFKKELYTNQANQSGENLTYLDGISCALACQDI